MNILNEKHSRLIFWPIIFSLIIAEYFLFRSYVLREVVNFYPSNFDQAAYLAHSYITYENSLREGLLSQFNNGAMNIATSYTFIPQAVMTFLLFGASRLAALSLNFIYFAVLQFMVVKAIRNLTQKNLFAFLSFGLILSLNTPFFWAGGILDFRIDFMAFCLFGIFVSCILQSNLFLNTKWTAITTLVAVYLILLRYITATYVFGIFFLLLGFFIWQAWRKTNALESLKIRIKHLSLAITATLLLVIPFFWSSRAAIYNYYVGGHFLTGEKYIRAAQVGVTNFISNIIFYPKSLIQDHLGFPFFIIVTALFSAYFISRSAQQKREAFNSSATLITIALACAVFVPVFILTMDFAKSPVVIGIITTPVILFITWIFYLVSHAQPNNKALNLFLVFTSFSIFSYGTVSYAKFMLTQDNPRHHKSLVQISKMYDDIGNYMLKNQQHEIVYSSDQIRDYIISQALSVIYYEKHGIILKTASTRLSGTIYAISESEAEKDVLKSNVFITNLNAYHPIPGDYPFDISLATIKPHLQKVADKKLQTLGDYDFHGSTYRVYVQHTTNI